MTALTDPGGPLVWGLVGGLTTFHGLSTLLISALREVSNARLEARLSSPEDVDLYHKLLQDDEETIADLSTLRGMSLIFLGVTLAWARLSPDLTVLQLASTALLALGLLAAAHVVPRTLGDRFAESIIIHLMPIAYRLLSLLRLLTWPFRSLATLTLRITGSPEEDAVEEADDEIRSAALEAVRDGVLERSALDMIERIIDFRDVEVTEVMTPRVDIIGISIDATFEDTVALLIEHGHSRLPVYEESIDRIVGIVHVKDILEALHKANGQPKPTIAEVLRKPLFVPESKRVRDLFGDIKLNKIHAAIVVDEYGGTAGMVTVSDIVSEVFGDVDDEHDNPVEREAIEALDERSYSIDGKVHIDEVNENLNLSIPEADEYDTIAGYLSACLGRIPSVGDEHRHEQLLFKVVEGDERKVDRVEILVEETASPAT